MTYRLPSTAGNICSGYGYYVLVCAEVWWVLCSKVNMVGTLYFGSCGRRFVLQIFGGAGEILCMGVSCTLVWELGCCEEDGRRVEFVIAGMGGW